MVLKQWIIKSVGCGTASLIYQLVLKSEESLIKIWGVEKSPCPSLQEVFSACGSSLFWS